MDPVSHLLMGRIAVAALERRPGETFGPGTGTAACLGALAPDIDFVLMPSGWDLYLRLHQVGTHSGMGACLLGGAVGLLLRFTVRGSRTYRLALAASIAAGTHLLLDLCSGASIGLAWPFLSTSFTLPLVA